MKAIAILLASWSAIGATLASVAWKQGAAGVALVAMVYACVSLGVAIALWTNKE